jgi:hypothetical protein
LLFGVGRISSVGATFRQIALRHVLFLLATSDPKIGRLVQYLPAGSKTTVVSR